MGRPPLPLPPVIEEFVFPRRVIFDMWFPKPFKMFKVGQFTKCRWFSLTTSFFLLLTFDVVCPKFYTSHRIGKVLEKYLFSAKIVKAA